MIRQVSAWGQFWWDLSSIHRVQGSAIHTPMCDMARRRAYVEMNGTGQNWRKPYFSTWIKWTSHGPVYYGVEGDTMTEMLRDGLSKTGCLNLRMKIALLAVLMEEIEFRVERTMQ